MPELPEVETISRELQASGIIGQSIKEIWIYWERSVAPLAKGDFRKKISGQKILRVSRRGKYIVFTLSHTFLLVHLRMTGKFSFPKELEHPPHERIRLLLSDGRILSYQDQRKFGRWQVADVVDEALSHLGVEPFSASFTLDYLKLRVAGKSAPIKAFLLNQEFIVGIGNIYADEALFEAQIHPRRRTDSLTEKELIKLRLAIKKVLRKGIKNQGTTLGSQLANYYSVSGRKGRNQDRLKVFRREGELCIRCGSIIQKIKLVQRGTHFCPHCQPEINWDRE